MSSAVGKKSTMTSTMSTMQTGKRNSHKMSNHPNGSRQRFKEFPSSEHGGFSGIIQREPPALPAGLARRLANKENYGLGKVKVMLRIFDKPPEPETASFMLVDKKKRQVALTDINALPAPNSSIQPDRGPMVAAPKLFAFDNLFTCDDAQLEVCASALSEVIPAVLEGSDGCLLTLGYPKVGQSKTMVGGLTSTELGAIPCAISWLYRGINERRQKSGARFSVRVSALGVSATKPATSSKDLLASYATDGDESSGYLRDDFLGGPTELRAPTAERAAHYFDAALAKRNALGLLEPALIFTLHVYQYSLHGKGGVAGGRSRLHLIDLGGCANRNGGLPLSGIGNVLLSILSGQKHPPNRDHPLTPLLKDCLAPLTCHVSILAHVAHSQTYADALTTIQLASRIHRLRRRKHRYPLSLAKAMGLDANGHPQSGGSSEGPDPSSSDFSADTVIYMGPHHDEATDGEHPPVYIPSLSSGDNRCVMSKALKGSSVEKTSKLPMKKSSPKIQSPTITQRTDSLKRNDFNMEIPPSPYTCPKPNPPLTNSLPTTPKMMASPLRHQALNSGTMGINKGCNVPTPKNSPLRRPQPNHSESPKRTVTEEQWIDGPRISKLKAAEARHMMREIQHVKQCETWIDGPKSTSPKKSHSNHNNNSLVQIPNSPSLLGGYGFMDQHKKTMIRQWVENQSTHILQQNSPNQAPKQLFNASQFKIEVDDDQISVESNSCEFVNPINSGFQISKATVTSSDRVNLKQQQSRAIDTCPTMQQPSIDLISNHSNTSYTKPSDSQEEEDQDSGPSEVPPALPLMEPLGSREVSHDSIHMLCSRHMSRESIGIGVAQTTDCGLQVTEEEIAKAMGCEHPLSALSIGDISIVSSFNVGDAFSDCVIGDRQRNQFDQLARLREIFTSQLAMAEVTPVFRINDDMSVFSEPAFRFSCGPESVCSEPVYRAPSPKCRDCRQSAGLSRTPSKGSLPSLTGIMAIAGMEQYANLRHPDGASDPNLQHKSEKNVNITANIEELDTMLLKQTTVDLNGEHKVIDETTILTQPQLSPLPLSTPEAYDSGHDSSTPRTSKHSGISRRAESGYHSVATVRDSDESSFGSGASRNQKIHAKKMKRNDKSLCNWLRNPFTCTYPDTEGEVSDF